MNIFALDADPNKSAVMLCDKHCGKMILESAQILCTAFDPSISPYKHYNPNGRYAKWARQTSGNFFWLLEHGLELSEEYQRRRGKEHGSTKAILWCIENANKARLDSSSDEVTVFIPKEKWEPNGSPESWTHLCLLVHTT